jgi:hypothetical protein
MEHNVVVEADWFIIEGENFIKKLAYFCPSLGKSGQFTFNLPPTAKQHRHSLMLQTKHSHGVRWNAPGNYRHDQVQLAFEDLVQALGVRPTRLLFFAKGNEKCKVLAAHMPYECGELKNLEDLGCPSYDKLSLLPKTTLSKAINFGLWQQKLPTLSLPPA